MRNNLQKSLHHFSICCVLMRPGRGQIYYYVQSIAQVIIFVNFTGVKMLYQVKDRMCRWCFDLRILQPGLSGAHFLRLQKQGKK